MTRMFVTQTMEYHNKVGYQLNHNEKFQNLKKVYNILQNNNNINEKQRESNNESEMSEFLFDC